MGLIPQFEIFHSNHKAFVLRHQKEHKEVVSM